IADGPMLDQLAVLDPPDVDLLGRELLAAGRLPQELADVAAVHDDPRDDLFSFTDLILEVESHRPPKPAEPRDRLLETLRALAAAGRRLVVDELGMHQLGGGLEPALLEQLLEHPLGELLVLIRHDGLPSGACHKSRRYYRLDSTAALRTVSRARRLLRFAGEL